jgi:mannitol/fructose-specific phosphotransferase system IIA component (Ntr-type)
VPSANVSRHVRESHCVAALKGTTREAVILELSQVFVDSGALKEAGRKLLMESVLEREAAGTTGIGNGVALPHPKAPEDVRGHATEALVAVGVVPHGVDFSAVDGAPVHAVFLVASPDPQEYLGLARRVAGLARDRNWPKLLKKCRTPREIRELVEEAWEGLRG